jgi:cytochrome c oxidase subunit 2
MTELLGLPEVASAHGGEIDLVINLTHWLMAVMFVGWGALFVYMLVRFRRRRNPRADYQGVKSHASRYAEWAIVLSEAILLAGFSIPMWSERVDAFPSPAAATEVRVVGEQFAWNVHYPGPDGVFGRTRVDLVDATTNPLGLDREDPAAADDVTTVNQLHLPVDRPAIVHLSSKDVIHSFMLNEFRAKQDSIPGLDIPLWFTPTVTTAEMRERTGDPELDYEIACAQLCGLGHYRMRGFLTVHTQDEYDAWMATEQEALQATEEGDDFWQ